MTPAGRAQEPLRYTLIYNPVSGRGSGRVAADRAATRLAAAGHAVERAETTPETTAETLARRAAEDGADRVVAIGGDGTIAEAAAGLLASGRPVPMAILPRGTANVLALNLRVPTGLERGIRVAMEGVPTPIDVGRVNGETFVLTVSLGLHAEVVARASRERKRLLGVAAYGLATLEATFECAPARYRIVHDDGVIETEASMVHVMNCGAILHRSWEFAPGISPVDGTFDVLIHKARNIGEYLTTVAHVIRGAPTSTSLVEHVRASKVEIWTAPPVRIQRDGEMSGESPATIEVLPGALPVLLPERSKWAA